MPRSRSVTVILRSCLNGNAIWIYRGPSKESARIAYWRACRKELERKKNWAERAARRRANIARMLSECTAELALDANLTPEQAAAAKQLQSIAGKGADFQSDFYDHFMEERRRREEDREIRRKMREREQKI